MSERPLTKQRVLIVDDREQIRRLARNYLTEVNEHTLNDQGISEIEVDEAGSVEEAKTKLRAAGAETDLVILDLELPEKADSDERDVDKGLALLEFIITNKNAKGVLVISNYDYYENVRAAFSGGAIDFVNKPLRQENFEPAVLNALARLMSRESDRLLNRRILELVAHSQLGLAHGFRQVFFRLLRDVSETAEGIERYAHERYGLDREKDPDDPLTLLLIEHERAMATARDEWARIQSELAESSTDFQSANVCNVLKNIATTMESALVERKLALTISKAKPKMVHTFATDVEIVLREIIAGALSELSNADGIHHMTVEFIDKPTRIGVIFEDDLDLIPEKQATAINEGNRIIPNEDFGRIWGLSVAQHIALRGGGEIKISSKQGWNVVSYFIPRTDHD